MLTGLKLSGQRKKIIKFVPAVLWLSLSLFEIEITSLSLEDSRQTSAQYNITVVKKGNLEITQHTSKLVCLIVVFPASIVQKGDTHTYTQLHRILGNICPPMPGTCRRGGGTCTYGYSHFRHFQNCCNRDGNTIFKYMNYVPIVVSTDLEVHFSVLKKGVSQYFCLYSVCTLVFGDEFLAQGLHLQSHQRC